MLRRLTARLAKLADAKLAVNGGTKRKLALSVCAGDTRVDKKIVDQDQDKGPEDSAHKAEELMEQAAYTPESEGRLWRLEWAQAFRRLAQIGKRDPD